MPDADTDVLLITVDGKGAPTISGAEDIKRRQPHRKGIGGLRQKKSGAPKKRRGPGKKSKNAKMAAVGVISLKADESGSTRPVNKRMYATFASYRALFVWLKAEALRRGYKPRPSSRRFSSWPTARTRCGLCSRSSFRTPKCASIGFTLSKSSGAAAKPSSAVRARSGNHSSMGSRTKEATATRQIERGPRDAPGRTWQHRCYRSRQQVPTKGAVGHDHALYKEPSPDALPQASPTRPRHRERSRRRHGPPSRRHAPRRPGNAMGQGPSGGRPSSSVCPSQWPLGRLRILPRPPGLLQTRLKAGTDGASRRQKPTQAGGLTMGRYTGVSACNHAVNRDLHPTQLARLREALLRAWCARARIPRALHPPGRSRE